MTEKTGKLVEIFIRDNLIIFSEELDDVETFYAFMLSEDKKGIIRDLKHAVQKIYEEDLETNYRIDQYGDVHEEDGSITPYEKIVVMINQAARKKYNIKS